MTKKTIHVFMKYCCHIHGRIQQYYEKNLSTQQYQKGKNSRLQGKNAYEGWHQCLETEKIKRAETISRIDTVFNSKQVIFAEWDLFRFQRAQGY